MKCVICGATIGNHEARAYVHVYRGDKPCRKLCACSTCSRPEGPFDRLIDALPINESGNPLDVSRAELEALKLATDRKRLEKRLRAVCSVLELATRRDFGRGRFDFEGRRLIGDNGMILQWQTRDKPDEPVTYRNQQTTKGTVTYSLVVLNTCKD